MATMPEQGKGDVDPRHISALTATPLADRQLSAAIGIARVLCILGIVYVHAWTGLGGDQLARLNDTPQALLRWGLIELLGRSSVPLLSIISGWLVARSLAKKGLGAFLAGKARTIVAPMILWNALAIVTVCGSVALGWVVGPELRNWWWVIDELLCLATPDDINVQMAFLRDLFVCVALAPLLLRLPSGWLALVALIALAWSISGYAFILLLRPSILLFFTIGILARRHGCAAWMASRPILLVATGYAVMAAAQIWLETVGIKRGVNDPMLLTSVDLLTRFTTALFFWSIAWRLAAGRFAALLLRIEPYAFLMFCAHLIMIWLGGPLLGRITGPLGSTFYPLLFLVQPLLVLAATLVLGQILLAISPGLASLLSGGRLSSDERRDDAVGRPAVQGS